MAYVVMNGVRVVQGAEWVVMGGGQAPVPANGPLPYSPRREVVQESVDSVHGGGVVVLAAGERISSYTAGEGEFALTLHGDTRTLQLLAEKPS